MAEAFARLAGAAAWSAGSRRAGTVNPRAIASMREVGYDLATHRSKSVAEVPAVAYDAVVTMGCGDACPQVAAGRRLDWDVADPKGMDEGAFRAVRDEIARRVKALLAS
jgi:arsenate reductase